MDDLHSKPKKLLNLINLCALSKHYLRNQRANLRNLREPRLFLAEMMPLNLCALSKHYLRNQRANLRNLREPRLFLAVMMPCRHRLFSPESARDLHSG